MYVQVKVKTSWREREIRELREDINTIVWDLQRLFNTKVDLNVDERKAETTFAFIGPMPAKKQGRAVNKKSKKQKTCKQ